MSSRNDARNRAARIISSDRSMRRLAQACIEPGRDYRRILGRCVVCNYNIPGPGEGDTCRWCQAKKEQQT